MTLLQVLLIISGFLLFVTALDILRRGRFNSLHFAVFLGIGGAMLAFTISPSLLNRFGQLFGVQRGADVLVYLSVIALFALSLSLWNRMEAQREDITRLVRAMALMNNNNTRK